jgi:hypothetical protein
VSGLRKAIQFAAVADQLTALEQDRWTFKRPDPVLKKIIEVESDRLNNAAFLLGREWNGMFSEAHVLLIAKAYHLTKKHQGDRA